MLALALLVTVQEIPLPPEEPFARTTIGVWKGEAETNAEHGRANLPVVKDVYCRLTTNGLEVSMDRSGRVTASVRGIASVSKDGDEESFSILSTRWLRIDGVRYEAKGVHIGNQPWRFTDIT
jgi:hypothetical protein